MGGPLAWGGVVVLLFLFLSFACATQITEVSDWHPARQLNNLHFPLV